ncbi:MAG: efflux RND transporter periplasmic adaptor subunit [Armatimonadota bacterium]|nr:efflux RND transporter periplasmic adaptor subunit [bacterium]
MAKGRKNSKLIITAAAILIVAVLFVAMKSKGGGEKIELKTEKVSLGTITTTVSATGVLESVTTVDVKSNVGGQVVWIGVEEGDMVKAGQVVARIDPTDTKSTLEESKANLASANAKVLEAQHNRLMQRAQYPAQLRAAQEAVASAKAQLAQARKEAEIQPKLTQHSIKQAESSLASAKASLAQYENALVPQNEASAKASYDEAKASVTQTKKELERQKALFAKDFVSRSAVESAEKDYDVAQAQLDTAKKKLDTVKAEVEQDMLSAQAKVAQARAELDTAKTNKAQDSIKKEALAEAQAAYRKALASLEETRATYHSEIVKACAITEAEADVKSSEASLEQAQKNVTYTTITAPRTGVVVAKYAEVGSIVTGAKSSAISSGSGVSLFEIADVSKMHATVDVDETDIAQIEVGQEVDVTVDAYPNEMFTGKVTKIAPQAETESNVTTIPVTVEIESVDLRLKPEMNATCDFVTARKTNVLSVPNSAIRDSGSQKTVVVIVDDKPASRIVKVGLENDDRTEITEGLKEGELVVTTDTGSTSDSESKGNSKKGGMGGPPMM